MTALITVEDLAFRYGSRAVFRHFDAQWGAKTVVIGANGSGKTTLLQIIARELMAQSGRVLCHNRSQYRAMTLFDDRLLFDHLTIASHFQWLCHACRKERSWLEAIRTTFALEPYWNRCPNALSSGQKRWCALSLALSVRADVYLFDEPLNVLDDEHKALWFCIASSLDAAIVATDQSHNRDLWRAPWQCAVLA